MDSYYLSRDDNNIEIKAEIAQIVDTTISQNVEKRQIINSGGTALDANYIYITLVLGYK